MAVAQSDSSADEPNDDAMASDFETDPADGREPSVVGGDNDPGPCTTSVRRMTEESDPMADELLLNGEGRNIGMVEDISVVEKGAKPELNGWAVVKEQPRHLNEVRVEVVLSMSPGLDRRAFAKVVCEDVDRVISKVPSLPGELWYEIVFEDGRIDQVRTLLLFALPTLRLFPGPGAFVPSVSLPTTSGLSSPFLLPSSLLIFLHQQ